MARLVDLSRDQVVDDRDDNIGPAKANAVDLPEDEYSAADRSRQVFYALAEVSEMSPGSEPKLNVSCMEEAMNKCGLNGKTCSRMFAVSKWSKGSGAIGLLDLAEFQLVIERFSSPVRMQKRLCRLVDDHVAERGIRFVYTVDEYLRTDTPKRPGFLQTELRGAAKEAELKDWDELLDGLLMDGGVSK